MRPTVWSMRWEHGATYSFLPVSCIHHPIGDSDLIKKWIKKVSSDPNAFTILIGDQFDLARTHYRDHLKAYIEDGNSQLAIDDLVRRQVKDLAEVLDPIQSKCVGVLQGNHHFQFSDQTTSDQYLCQLMKWPYLGALSVFRVDFKEKNGHQRYAMPIAAHHHGGCRGTRTVSADVAALKRFEDGFEAQIYVAGHTHRKLGFKQPKLTIPSRGNPIPREYTKVYMRAGAFLKGFQPDNPQVDKPHSPSYAEKDALSPVDLGSSTCTWHFEQGPSGSYFPKFELRF